MVALARRRSCRCSAWTNGGGFVESAGQSNQNIQGNFLCWAIWRYFWKLLVSCGYCSAPTTGGGPFISPQAALVFRLVFQGMYDEADLLFLREIEILEKTVGRDHPDLAATLSNRAALLRAQVRLNHSIQSTSWRGYCAARNRDF